MIQYREFRNADPPALVEIWRQANPQLAQQMNVSLLEDLVLGKPYFDRAGLLLACEDGRIVAFGHAGFGPSVDHAQLSHDVGVICLIVVRPTHRGLGIGRELALQLERYLGQRGARTVYAGGVRPFDPFYSGLYGGLELPGVLGSDTAARKMFESIGFRVVDQLRRMRCDLSSFRPVVDRSQMQARRTYQVTSLIDSPPADWWEACTFGEFHRIRVELCRRGGGSAVAMATLWSADPIAWSPGERSVGLVDIQVPPELRRKGLATHLLGEALRLVHQHGFHTAEAQVLERDEAAGNMLAKLGFQEAGRGAVYRKELTPG